jgi:hypothetical protein
MNLVIIESPYAGNVELNVSYARRAVKDSLGRGESPIASHLLYTQMAEEYGYRVVSLIVENRHGVPDEKVQQIRDRFEIQL